MNCCSFLFSVKTPKAIRAHFHALIIFLLAFFGNSPGLPPERKHSHQRKRAALDTRLHKCYKMNKRCAVPYRFFRLVILRKRKPPVRVRADRRFAFICRSSCHIHIFSVDIVRCFHALSFNIAAIFIGGSTIGIIPGCDVMLLIWLLTYGNMIAIVFFSIKFVFSCCVVKCALLFTYTLI